MSRIYHITTRAAWQQALQCGEYRPQSLEREGFIHFSERAQLLKVANAFYRGQSGLVVLAVETERLKAELRYEPPVHPKADGETDEKADAEADAEADDKTDAADAAADGETDGADAAADGETDAADAEADAEADDKTDAADAETDAEADELPSAALFPHLYGALNTDAVVQVIELIPNEQGGFDASVWNWKAETLTE